MTSKSFVFTDLANTMKYGEGFLFNLVFTAWRHCVSQNEVWGKGCYIPFFSPSDVTAFHRIPKTYSITGLLLLVYNTGEGIKSVWIGKYKLNSELSTWVLFNKNGHEGAVIYNANPTCDWSSLILSTEKPIYPFRKALVRQHLTA